MKLKYWFTKFFVLYSNELTSIRRFISSNMICTCFPLSLYWSVGFRTNIFISCSFSTPSNNYPTTVLLFDKNGYSKFVIWFVDRLQLSCGNKALLSFFLCRRDYLRSKSSGTHLSFRAIRSMTRRLSSQ